MIKFYENKYGANLRRLVIDGEGTNGYVSDEDLSILYQNALLYVFPSINEGFGIPILEAFKSNIPVLIANNTRVLITNSNQHLILIIRLSLENKFSPSNSRCVKRNTNPW